MFSGQPNARQSGRVMQLLTQLGGIGIKPTLQLEVVAWRIRLGTRRASILDQLIKIAALGELDKFHPANARSHRMCV